MLSPSGSNPWPVTTPCPQPSPTLVPRAKNCTDIRSQSTVWFWGKQLLHYLQVMKTNVHCTLTCTVKTADSSTEPQQPWVTCAMQTGREEKKHRQVWCHSVACDHSSLSVEMITSQKLKSNRYWSQGMRKHRQPGSCPEARDESQRLGQTLELWLISTDTWTSRTRGRAHNRQGKPRRRAAPWLAVQPKPHSLLGLSSGQQINTCTSTHRCSF